MKAFFTTLFAALAAAAPASDAGRQALPHLPRAGENLANKKGLAYNGNGIPAVLPSPDAASSWASWAYNWGTGTVPGITVIPMCHTPGSQKCDKGQIQQAVSQGANWVLGYNEPDFDEKNGGSARTPQDAWTTWAEDTKDFHGYNAQVVCPAISSYNTAVSKFTGYPAGLTWLDAFATAAGGGNNLGCDAQALHWYGYGLEGQSGEQQAQAFIEYMEFARGEVNRIFKRDMDVWVTEFAAVPLHDQAIAQGFLSKALPYLDSQPWVTRYTPIMIDSPGSAAELHALTGF